MFEYLIESGQKNVKRLVSRWLQAFVIEPILVQPKAKEGYLKGFDRKKAAESCYEYLALMNELDNTLVQVDKRKLVKDIAIYIDLRTPFVYNKKRYGTPDYQFDIRLFEEIPFHFKSNNRRGLELIREAKKSVVLNRKTLCLNEKPSVKQIKLIEKTLNKKKLRVGIDEINKYQASILIPFLLDNEIYDEEELHYLIQ